MAAICYSYYYQMRAQLDAARLEHTHAVTEVQALELENSRIAAEIEALRNDPETIEFFARQELGMVRPGESVLTISRPGSQH